MAEIAQFSISAGTFCSEKIPTWSVTFMSNSDMLPKLPLFAKHLTAVVTFKSYVGAMHSFVMFCYFSP